MVAARRGYLIANDSFRDQGLRPLHAPLSDARALRDLLTDPEVGGFNPVRLAPNVSKAEAERDIEEMFRSAGPDDLLLLYYSGHGVLSERGKLYLAVSNTETSFLAATAISASFLTDLIEETAASSVVLVLDCCYSGAFPLPAGKSPDTVDTGEQLHAGRGVYVLAASNAVQRAADGEPAGPDRPATLSAFTEALIRGLGTGQADVRSAGLITPDDLFDYLRRELPPGGPQTPTKRGTVESEVHLARVRVGGRYGPPHARVHLGDLLGPPTFTEDRGLRTEQWQGARLEVPIGQEPRPGDAAGRRAVLDLAGQHGHVLVVGRAGSGKSTLFRTLAGALALTHSRDEVRFHCLDSGANRLGVLGKLPHFEELAGDDEPQKVAAILHHVEETVRVRKRLFRGHNVDASMGAWGRDRLPGGPHPDLFLLVDQWQDFARASATFADRIVALANNALGYGVHLVIAARSWSDLPDELPDLLPGHIELRINQPELSRIDPRLAERLPPDRPGLALLIGRLRFQTALPSLRVAGGPATVLDGAGDGADELVDRIASAWQSVRSVESPPTGGGPAAGTEPRAELLSWSGWPERGEEELLRVVVGATPDGQPLPLDLKEAAQGGVGPHGLLVGSTGSGKSELLRGIVLRLALSHPPDLLNFAFVDYKGGTAFADLAALPHTAALATDLAAEPDLPDRLTAVLSGELVRRQELLRTAGLPSQPEYRRAYRAGRLAADAPPMPSLLVVCDEFNELLSAAPDLIDLLLQVSRLGRSHGVHLLLASQRLEEGRIRGLDSYLGYRIGLRTFSAADSRTVLGIPDAYELPPAPGNGYLKIGSGDPVRFRSAPAVPPGTGDELDDLVRRVREAAAGRGAVPLWLPPLAEPVALSELVGPLLPAAGRGLAAVPPAGGALSAPVGLVDAPFEHRRNLLRVDLTGDAEQNATHIAVVGGPRSGKSTLLATAVCSLALHTTPREVQFYCLDLGGALAPLRGLPHLGALAGPTDEELVRRIVRELADLAERRTALAARHGVLSVAAYRRRRAAGELTDPFGDVVLVVDDWRVVRNRFEDLEPVITELAVSGRALGIHLLVSATRWEEMRPKLQDAFHHRMELRLSDPSGSALSRRDAARIPDQPGRGLTAGRQHFLAAVPTLDAGIPSGPAVAQLVRAVREAWSGPVAPPIRTLPPEITLAELTGPDQPPVPRGAVRLGVSEERLAPVDLDLSAESHLLVLGDNECGKSSTLRLIAQQLTSQYTPEQARLVIVDYRRSLLGAVQSDHALGYGVATPSTAEIIREVADALTKRLPGPDVTAEQLRARDWWHGPDLYLLVDDYDLVAGSSANPLLGVLDLLAQARDVGFHLVVARRSGGAARALYDPLLARMRELGSPGLLMSASSEEGTLISPVRSRPLPPGRATLVTHRAGPTLLQVAWAAPPY